MCAAGQDGIFLWYGAKEARHSRDFLGCLVATTRRRTGEVWHRFAYRYWNICTLIAQERKGELLESEEFYSKCVGRGKQYTIYLCILIKK
jgi:hypothetical protein